MEIRRASNGYIVCDNTREYVYTTLEEVLEHALLRFEERASIFTGSLYGKVLIVRDKDETCQ